MGKKVSFISTVLNEADFVGEMVSSLLCQDHPDVEVVVVDDGSTDKTPRILADLARRHPNVKVVTMPGNVGKAKAQNAGYRAATGDYIAIMGGDDYVLFNRVSAQLEALEKNGSSCVYTNMVLVDRTGNPLPGNSLFFKSRPVLSAEPRDLIRGSAAPGGTLLFTRALAEKIYPIPEHLPYEDRWFSFIALRNGGMYYLDKPLTFYRQHAGNNWGLFLRKNVRSYVDRLLSLTLRDGPYVEAIGSALKAEGEWPDSLESYFQFRRFYHSETLRAPWFRKLGIVSRYYSAISFNEAIIFLFPRYALSVKRFLGL